MRPLPPATNAGAGSIEVREVRAVAATGEGTAPVEEVDLTDVQGVVELLTETIRDLGADFVRALPLYVLALLVFVLGLVVVRLLMRGVDRGLGRARLDPTIRNLASRLGYAALFLLVILLALAIAGVEIGAALAGIGIAGLALAFALQNILENLIAGVLLLIRKPFRIGDQIITNEFEGTVEDINLRVTRVITYAGETVLIPNAEVFTKPVINLTTRGNRRTSVMIGIDYRDDHDRAREVIRQAIVDVEGVLAAPEVEVLLTELGESSVDFEVRYWTAPDIRSVRFTQDRVLSAAKTAIEGAGMTIPWPIRTLSFDNEVRVRGRVGATE